MFFSRLASTARAAVRQVRHEAAFSTLTVLTLAVGIAASTAMFAVVRGVLLRPLPYRDTSAIVAIQEFQPAQRKDQATVASANLPRLKAARTLASVSAFSYAEYVLSGDAEAERVLGARIDGQLLTVLGVRPILGRGIAEEETGANPARVAVLSNAVWRRRFSADSSVIGRSVTIDGAPHSIVGIMPANFEFPRNPAMARDVDVWVPRRPPPPMMLRRGIRDLTVIARLREGMSLQAAQRELETIAMIASSEDATLNAGWNLRAIGLRDFVVGPVRPALVMLSACVAVLMLIACVNASAGALARITTKQQTLGVRLALGASHRDLVRLLVGESLVLALAAVGVALPLSAVLRRMLVAAAPISIPRQNGIAMDGWTIGFVFALAIVAGLATATAPTAWLRRFDLAAFMSDAGRTATGSRRSRALGGLVVAQLALGTVLLAGAAGLFVSFARVNRVDPGFAIRNVTTATLPLGGMRYQEARARRSLTGQLLEKVRAIPGVERAAVTSLLPLSGGMMSGNYAAAGEEGDSSSTAALRSVSDDFFMTIGIPVLHGRAILPTDDDGAAPVVVVNDAFERRAFRSGSALGRSITVTPPGSDEPREFQIVGVAGDAKEKDLLAPATPIIYFSDRQASFPHSVLVVRTSGPYPATAVRAALRDLDPSLALDDVGSLAARVRASYALQFFLLSILGAFALCAAALIAVGVYGSISFEVATELRATGVRMALGASPWRVLGTVVAHSGRLAALGCMIGLIGVTILMRMPIVASVLGEGIGVAAAAAGAGAVLLVSLLAAAGPAHRASKLDPLTILRDS